MCGLALLIGVGCGNAPDIEKFSLPGTDEIHRADFYVLRTGASHQAVLVLCPQLNASGESLVQDPAWQQFARENQLALIGVYLTSDKYRLRDGKGYYYPERGSGELLLQAIEQALGEEDLPLLLYGFSGGAQLVSRFVAWKPERVTAWCAYAASWWAAPEANPLNPAGIVASGELDAAALGASLEYFKQGRSAGKPWTWVSIRQTGHRQSREFQDFVRKYFVLCLQQQVRPPADGCWVDIGTEEQVPADAAAEQAVLSSWLPDPSLHADWAAVHDQ
ncbi:MAG: hypothetical protein AAGH72_13600 [Verrucomicrobiota bacterium]